MMATSGARGIGWVIQNRAGPAGLSPQKALLRPVIHSTTISKTIVPLRIPGFGSCLLGEVDGKGLLVSATCERSRVWYAIVVAGDNGRS